ncbi:hypothetical protein CRG98_049510, partial [Punica granatum]
MDLPTLLVDLFLRNGEKLLSMHLQLVIKPGTRSIFESTAITSPATVAATLPPDVEGGTGQ